MGKRPTCHKRKVKLLLKKSNIIIIKRFSMHGNNLTAKTVSNLNNNITDCIHSYTKNNVENSLKALCTNCKLLVVIKKIIVNYALLSEGLRLAALYEPVSNKRYTLFVFLLYIPSQ